MVLKATVASLEIKNLGVVSMVLGTEVHYEPGKEYRLSQTAKIKEMVTEYRLEDAKPTHLPIATNYASEETDQALPDNNEFVSKRQYQRMVGSWLRIFRVTTTDWELGKRVIRLIEIQRHDMATTQPRGRMTPRSGVRGQAWVDRHDVL